MGKAQSGLVCILFLPSYEQQCLPSANGALIIVFTASGGFATVHPGSILTINAVEAAPLESFSADVST